MATHYIDIEKALIQAFRATNLEETPTSYPDVVLSEDQKPDGLWFALHNMRSESTPVTLGDKGEDNHPGFLQIDINYPDGKGSSFVLTEAGRIAAEFPSGRTLIYNSQKVRITSSSLSPGRLVGGYYQVVLTIYYYSRSTRNAQEL